MFLWSVVSGPLSVVNWMTVPDARNRDHGCSNEWGIRWAKNAHELDDLELALVRQIEAACRRFEADCRAGKRPAIDDYLGDIPPHGHAALRAELAALEIELREVPRTTPLTIAASPTIAAEAHHHGEPGRPPFVAT